MKPSLPPKPGSKPSLAPKPKSVNKPVVSSIRKQNTASESLKSEDLDADDILKYIQQQSEKQAQHVDLFS